MDQRMIHTMLEIVVCWGIYPCLLPGVGMPLNRRVRSNIFQNELFTSGSNSADTPIDGVKSTNLLWTIAEPLARITVAYSPKITRFTTLGSILASRHVPDLYAALLQLAYRPLPKPRDQPIVPADSGTVGSDMEPTVAPKPKKITPGSLLSKASRSSSGDTASPLQEATPQQQLHLNI